MAKVYAGSGVRPRLDPAGNGAYFRTRDMGLINPNGYVAQPGDIFTHIYWQRGSSASTGTDLRLEFFGSPTGVRTDAVLEDFRLWSAPGGTAYEQYLEYAFAEPFVPVPGRTYYFICRGIPGSYAARAATKVQGTQVLALTDAATPSTSPLPAAGWSAVNAYGSVLGIMVANLYAKTVVALGAGVPTAQHIARDASDHKAAGTMVRHSDFTAQGTPVTIRSDGSFVISGEGHSTFEVEFSADGGVTWSPPQVVTVVDATL